MSPSKRRMVTGFPAGEFNCSARDLVSLCTVVFSVFSGAKPPFNLGDCGTTKVVPCYKTAGLASMRSRFGCWSRFDSRALLQSTSDTSSARCRARAAITNLCRAGLPGGRNCSCHQCRLPILLRRQEPESETYPCRADLLRHAFCDRCRAWGAAILFPCRRR